MASNSDFMILACLLIILLTKMVNGRRVISVEEVVLRNKIRIVKGAIAGKTVDDEEFRRYIEKVLNENICRERQLEAADKIDNEEAIRRHVEKMLELIYGIKLKTQVENGMSSIQIGLYIFGGVCSIIVLGFVFYWFCLKNEDSTVKYQFIDVESGLNKKRPKRPFKFSLHTKVNEAESPRLQSSKNFDLHAPVDRLDNTIFNEEDHTIFKEEECSYIQETCKQFDPHAPLDTKINKGKCPCMHRSFKRFDLHAPSKNDLATGNEKESPGLQSSKNFDLHAPVDRLDNTIFNEEDQTIFKEEECSPIQKKFKQEDLHAPLETKLNTEKCPCMLRSLKSFDLHTPLENDLTTNITPVDRSKRVQGDMQ